MEDYVVVGRVGRAHGLRGEVSVEPRTDEPERRFAIGSVLSAAPGTLTPGPDPLTVSAARTHQGRLLVTFEEIVDRTGAETLRGTELVVGVDPEDVPADPEEFYDHQLRGLVVEIAGGELVGAVERIEHGPAQDLLVIATPNGEVLFPFVAELVPAVDLEAGRIVVDDRPGLLRGV